MVLIETENSLARSTRDKLLAGDDAAAREAAAISSPLDTISELLAKAGIPVKLSISDGAIFASKRGGVPYSVAALSDGERSAFLTAGVVLTAKPGSLILIDEPERHLHGSIVTSLLSQLFSERPDCAFIVSTHELSLPLECDPNKTAIVRDCRLVGEKVSSWDIDMLGDDCELDESVKEAILGARRQIVFVEGRLNSLDKQLYELLFVGATVVACGTCGEVEKRVDGIRASSTLHRVQAIGIVDQDQLTPDRKATLIAKGVYPLNTYSVEGLYYHPAIQARVAKRQSLLTGSDPDEMVRAAAEALINAVREQAPRLAARMAEQTVRDAISLQMPDWRTIMDKKSVSITIDVNELHEVELKRISRYIETHDIEGIVARYPIRDTRAIALIAKAFGLKDNKTYEAAVRKCVADDPLAKKDMLALMGELPSKWSVN